MNIENYQVFALREFLHRKYASDFAKHARWIKKQAKKIDMGSLNIDEWNIIVRPEIVMIKKDETAKRKTLLQELPPKQRT